MKKIKINGKAITPDTGSDTPVVKNLNALVNNSFGQTRIHVKILLGNEVA